MRQQYEAEFAQRLADDSNRKARARASRRSGRKSGKSVDDAGSSGTNEESLSTPPTVGPFNVQWGRQLFFFQDLK